MSTNTELISRSERVASELDDHNANMDRRARTCIRELVAALKSMEQAITDPENQPSQLGTVLLATQRALEAAVERLKAEIDDKNATIEGRIRLNNELAAQLAAAQGQAQQYDEALCTVAEQRDTMKLRIRQHLANRYAYMFKEFCEELEGMLYAAPIPQQASVPAECCEHCDDGDGLCVFPMYGPAPHTHDTSSGWIGSTRTLPKDQWGNNFREDPDCEGHGVYMRCEKCGRGEQPAAAAPQPKETK